MNNVASVSEAFRQATSVGGVASRFWGVVQAYDGYAQFGSGHGATLVLTAHAVIELSAMARSRGDMEESMRVVDLSEAPGERATWGRSRFQVYLWAIVELLIVTNPLQISSRVRTAVLRAFGAQIGRQVIFRPRTRVKFPWKLRVGDRSWIGEGVWIHNQDFVDIGDDVVISQESFITTGSHSHRIDMALITSPVMVADGTWVTARCMILGGTSIGKSSLVTPMSLVKGRHEENAILSGNPAIRTGDRFRLSGTN